MRWVEISIKTFLKLKKGTDDMNSIICEVCGFNLNNPFGCACSADKYEI